MMWNPLDVTSSNIGLFAQGNILLIHRDLHNAVLRGDILDTAVSALDLDDLDGGRLFELKRAFSVRRNIIAFKKVAKHVLESAEHVEDDLARGCTWHFHNLVHDASSGQFSHHPDYRRFAQVANA
jgi:hypothetical protein